MQQDVAALSDELLAQTLPADKREPGNKPHILVEEKDSEKEAEVRGDNDKKEDGKKGEKEQGGGKEMKD